MTGWSAGFTFWKMGGVGMPGGSSVAAFVMAARPSWSQSSGRHLTTIDALRRFSGYFHLQNIKIGAYYFAVQPLWSNEANGGTGGCAVARGKGAWPAPPITAVLGL